MLYFFLLAALLSAVAEGQNSRFFLPAGAAGGGGGGGRSRGASILTNTRIINLAREKAREQAAAEAAAAAAQSFGRQPDPLSALIPLHSVPVDDDISVDDDIPARTAQDGSQIGGIQDDLLQSLLASQQASQNRPVAPQFGSLQTATPSQILSSLRGPVQVPDPKVVFAGQEQTLGAGLGIAHQLTTPAVPTFTPSCPRDDQFRYLIPHPQLCDEFYLCEAGVAAKRTCEDGFVLDLDSAKCVQPTSGIECQGRPLLQPPKGTGPCLRRNGYFYTNQTCDTYVKCTNDIPAFHQCAQGLVYDPKIRTCAFPDDAERVGCQAEDILGFRCPNPKLSREEVRLHKVVLRFGDHDRHAHPEDCRYFFMCLRTGQPRLGGCTEGKVFNRGSGVCDLPENVPECRDYYAGSGVQTRLLRQVRSAEPEPEPEP